MGESPWICFRPPIFNKESWEGFHGGWPMTIVMDLCKSLPDQYTAEPRVHLGKNFEVDVWTFDVDDKSDFASTTSARGPATALWAPPEPTLSPELDPTEIYEYEVLIFDQQRGRELIEAVAVEIDVYSWQMWRKLPACGFRTTF